MKHLCYSCKIYKDCHHGLTSAGIIAGCPHYEKLVVTNADRIRSMSDEDLAEFMCHNVSNGKVNCAFCAAAEFCRTGHNGWLDWLKEEAKGENDEI